MASKARVALVPAALLLLFACTRESTPSSSSGSNTDAGIDAASPYSFFPQNAARNCAQDSDCVVLPTLSGCTSCCGLVSVARGEAERQYAAAVDACTGPGGPGSSGCALYCGNPQPHCFEGSCVSLAERDDAGQLGPGSTSGDVCAGGDAGAPSGPIEPLGPGPSCGARAVTTGFEDGLDPTWAPGDASAFQIERTDPLSGAASLRMSYRQKTEYLSIAQPDACAVRIAFTIRTHLLASGLTLARIVAGDGWWFHVRLDSCSLTIAEEIHTTDAIGIGFPGPGPSIPDDTPMRVVLTFDTKGQKVSSQVAPLGQPLPAPTVTPTRGSGTGIRAIELGSAPGVQASGVGIVWIDDLSID